MGAPVRITLGIPRQLPPGRFRWPFLSEAAPKPWYFRSAPEKFDRMYRAQLARFADDIDIKLTWLADRYPGQALVCLCYERRARGPADCHRRIFADWWTERTGDPVPELDGRTRP
jgi:hypothetical protein